MIRQRMMAQLAILFLLLGTSMAWSKRMHKPGSTHAAHDSEIAAESKVKPSYSQDPKTAESYMVDDVYPKGHGHSDGYLDSEEHKSVKEEDEAQGNEDSDHTIKNDEVDDYSEKGGRQGFQAGGSSFDKHLKDHKADNKEIENVKEHDASEKFGGEATKEHKLGKHKEKSKGHKLHGFKNVYHKEEYGDHKTFHDEFLDSDHHHNYDDHHEHQEMQGGKFSKGYKHEGKNDKHDKGDEKHEWGKEEFDGHHEGKHEKGRQKAKHRHATKKHQGHYDANAQRQKNTVHKVKKGVPPPPPLPPHVPHGGHHGPHQAQIEPYVSQYNSHHEQVNVPSHSYIPLTNKQPHQIQFDDDKSINNEDHGSLYHNHDSLHNGHRGHHHEHGGHRDSDVSDEYYPKDDSFDSDFQDRTARNHDHRSLIKDSLEDKSDEKFAPVIKHEPVARKHEPIVHKNEPIVHTHEPIVHKHEPIVRKHEPIVRTHESIGHKHEPHTHKHRPHSHQYQSHGYKQSFSPNSGLQQYRQPVFQENSQPGPSQSSKPEKFSDPFNEKLHNHDHRIRYGHQPRNHQRQHHLHHRNPRIHHNFNPHRHHTQPFPRFSGFNHHHRSIHPTNGHHHHHGPHKNHSHFRYTPRAYQQEPKPEVHSPKPEYTSSKSTTDESQHTNSHKHYE